MLMLKKYYVKKRMCLQIITGAHVIIIDKDVI